MAGKSQSTSRGSLGSGASRMDYYPPNTKEEEASRNRPLAGRSMRADYIRPRVEKPTSTTTESEESSQPTTNAGGAHYPASSVLEELADKTVKELDSYLKDFGFKTEDIRGFGNKEHKAREVALWLAEDRDEWQSELPEGWPEEE